MDLDAEFRIEMAVFLERWFQEYGKIAEADTSPKPGPERAEWRFNRIQLWNGLRNLSRRLAEWVDRNFTDPPLDSAPLWEMAGMEDPAGVSDGAWKAAWILASKMQAKVGTIEQAKADYMIERIPEPCPNQVPADRTTLPGVAARNLWFLQQYEASGMDTYHKPVRIKAKWWAMQDEERAAICPASPGKVTTDTVVTGIKRAQKLRDDNASKPPKKRKRPARKT